MSWVRSKLRCSNYHFSRRQHGQSTSRSTFCFLGFGSLSCIFYLCIYHLKKRPLPIASNTQGSLCSYYVNYLSDYTKALLDVGDFA